MQIIYASEPRKFFFQFDRRRVKLPLGNDVSLLRTRNLSCATWIACSMRTMRLIFEMLQVHMLINLRDKLYRTRILTTSVLLRSLELLLMAKAALLWNGNVTSL